MSIIVYQGMRLEANRLPGGRSMHTYDVTLLEGEWPEDKDLITHCNGGHPSNPCHFGGHVEKTGANTARVVVYVD